ncbi:LysM peptidoglycan-binding domain-containing protein [Chryseobacterium sp. SSA4.19]|uniref:LysM peptidoglycan-binding domain-containing protein n=1 Tax=Chryseobacterium sp. SSA4.19 TaxID=2919915 RepID=UPI001F4D3D6B|nr:LysM domain-containing protein [Chryseobacterium sp. SSA4.19]MCJ8155752.1 LysM peptidoglycan-binding domain-containing protein [Chryseobacterium sp. SSA4.19]
MMNENILLHEVQPGDTLEKIGKTIGMTSDQLKDFHNSHCNRMDKLWFDNLVGVRQIFVPKAYKSPEELIIEKKKELPPPDVTKDFYADNYSVKETFSNSLGNDLVIEYKININFKINRETNLPYLIADVRCYDFTKNTATPNDKMSLISLACMESIYPISFMVYVQGKISGIFEFEKLRQRFEKRRPDLEDFFIGEIYKTYLDKFHASLENQEFILKQFSSALLYQLLFPKTEWFYKTNNWTEDFHFVQNSFHLKCIMSAEYNHENTETVETLLKGSIKDPFCLQEIIRGISFNEESDEPANSQVELWYLTDKKTKKMLEAEASVSLWNDNELYRKQTLKLTQDEEIS